MKMDDKLVEILQGNEQIIQVIQEDLLLKAWKENKDTLKSAASFTAPTLDISTATKIIKEFGFRPSTVQIKTYANGKRYVIFKGYAGKREIFQGVRYLASNPKIVRMAIGPKGIAKSIKGGFVLTFVLFSGIEVIDYILSDKATLSHLLGTLTTDFFKIGISSVAAALAATMAGGAIIFGSTVAAPFIVAIAIGIGTGLILDKIDKRFGVTQALIQGYKNIGLDLDKMTYEFKRDLRYIEKNPFLINCLFAPCGVFDIQGY